MFSNMTGVGPHPHASDARGSLRSLPRGVSSSSPCPLALLRVLALASALPRRVHRGGPSAPATRSSVGGWLENSLLMPPMPANGLMMNMCAVAGFASSGT